MPNSVTCMWLRGREGAIAAALYGPSAGEFDLPDGRIRSMEVEWTLKTKNRVKLSSDAAHGAQDNI